MIKYRKGTGCHPLASAISIARDQACVGRRELRLGADAGRDGQPRDTVARGKRQCRNEA